DTAFQSRIHVAVRYKPLGPQIRRKIWENFIERLDDGEQQAKEELRQNLDDLAEWELNGRQIRNVLTIAQSLALSRGRRSGAMRYAHVEKVASETIGFQEYFESTLRESRTRLGETTDHAWPGSRSNLSVGRGAGRLQR